MKQTLIAFVACLCVAATIALPSNAQPPNPAFPPNPGFSRDNAQSSDPLDRPGSAPRRPVDGFPPPQFDESTPERPPITDPYQRSQIAQQQLASAKTDEEKNKAKETLSKALSDCFDQDVKNRESELESIRTRLAEMEAQLKKRIDGKDEIVRLRLQVLANNASGLGWADVSSNSFGNFVPPTVLRDTRAAPSLRSSPYSNSERVRNYYQLPPQQSQ